MRFSETKCCALVEIDLLGKVKDAAAAMKEVQDQFRFYHEARPTMLLFTGVTTRRRQDHTYTVRADDYGGNFRTYIETHKLGTVVETPETENPKTRNGVKAWLWTPNWTRVLTHTLVPTI